MCYTLEFGTSFTLKLTKVRPYAQLYQICECSQPSIMVVQKEKNEDFLKGFQV